MKSLALTLALAVTLADATAQESDHAKRVKQHLAHWLDPEKCPDQGLDSNIKDLVAQTLPKIQAAAPDQLAAAVKDKRNILVLTTDTAGPLHAPGAAGLLVLLRELRKKHPDLQFSEFYSAKDLPVDKLSDYDAIILNNVTMVHKSDYDFYNKILPEYVQNGGGLLAVHGAAVPYRNEDSAPYNALLGGYTTTPQVHPQKHCASPFPVLVPDPDNPLAAAFLMEPAPFKSSAQWFNGKKRCLFNINVNPPATLADELYTFNLKSNADGKAKIIAAIDKTKLNTIERAPTYPQNTPDFGYAIAWCKPHGQGRVYYTQFGHNYCVFAIPPVAKSITDAIQYTCGDLKVK